MKKNKMMRLASALLVAVLLTTSVISGTYAKYVTTGTATDTARVAKWGVTITSTANGDAFNQTYAKTDSETEFANTVIAAEDVVAPGTSGTLTDVVVAGTPEVAVRVTYEATLELTGWEVDGAEYCPLEITVENTKFKVGQDDVNDIETLIEKVVEAIENCKKEYPANETIDYGTDAPSVSWAWAFEGNDDVKDTALGNLAADGDAPTIKLEIVTTATQID